MTDRLKDIWSGFSNRTSARLTSTEIGPFSRPDPSQRAERRSAQEQAFDAGRADESDAVSAALQALHTDLQAKAKRHGGRRRKEAGASFASADEVAPPPSGLEERLLADIKFTEARVRRRPSDYLSYAAERQADWQKRKRKKFLGIF
jgi:hypothetical protein